MHCSQRVSRVSTREFFCLHIFLRPSTLDGPISRPSRAVHHFGHPFPDDCVFSFGIRSGLSLSLKSVLPIGIGLGLMSALAGPLAEATAENDRPIVRDVVSRAMLSNVIESGPYHLTPERRALLNTIRYAEGTWKDGEDMGYQVLYGGGLFEDLSSHPEEVIVKRYASAAAGAYQFLPATWNSVAKELELESFEPPHQDQAALHLVKRRGALQEVDRNGLTKAAMDRLAPEWASFPTKAGRSVYGQPVKTHSELAEFYSENLEQLRMNPDA